MNGKEATREEWLRLYDAANRVRELQPWEWMEDEDLFGVQNPENGELGFVSVEDELIASVTLLVGARGLYGFLGYINDTSAHLFTNIYETPQIDVTFENRLNLTQHDMKQIKDLGLKFRGRHSWPMFRSIHPGFVPWDLEAEEVRFFTVALEQTINVSTRLKDDPLLIMPENLDQPDSFYTYLVRVPEEKDGQIEWTDRMMRIERPAEQNIKLDVDRHLLRRLKKMPKTGHELEIDLFMFPTPFQDTETSRPYYPYMLLIVDTDTGAIVNNDLLSPAHSLEKMLGSVPVKVMDQLREAGIVPDTIYVESERMERLLRPMVTSLGITLTPTLVMPALNQIREFILQTLDD